MQKIQSNILGEIVSSNSSEAHSLYKKSHFGEKIEDKIQYSFSEVLFLVENKKMDVFSRNKKISKKELLKKFQRFDKKIQIKYPVFKNLRQRGYILKTALKFGADFRVYNKGSKPGKKHAKWVVFVDHESKKLTWHEFSAKNRVAHSTKKNLLLAIVDEESGITYYEVSWLKL
jgi:tRNA-intron endonuclease|tara:strand:+ start:3814 stop:4332 length:519 start_codon:yes stop_codon:yes gene_type:complete